ncbi:MAG: hypothetical protein KC503_27780 [Myxococcales bacterium]|nr:hypothetical protein [Myxococcales bacterium]
MLCALGLVVVVVTTGGCLDWNASRLEGDGRTDQGIDGDAGKDTTGDAPKDMPGDGDASDDASDTTRDQPIGDSTHDSDGDMSRDGTPDTPDAGADSMDAMPDTTRDGIRIDGDLGALRGNGSGCATNSQCLSGWCIDGVCCNKQCDGKCETCSANPGICQPVAEGSLPPSGKTCPTGSGCNEDGRCDGVGRCRTKPLGSTCSTATCTSTTYNVPKICNAAASCVNASATTTISCGSYKCSATTVCQAPCGSNGNCSTGGNTCSGGKCNGTLYPLGTACNQGTECASGICQQGFCCLTSCSGPCKSCGVAGLEGQCVDVPAGEPSVAGGCAVNGCTTDGRCDGNGACRTTRDGTPCGTKPVECTGTTDGTLTMRTCQSGQCTEMKMTCGKYKCQNGTSCLGRCSTGSHCAQGFTCNQTTRNCQ